MGHGAERNKNNKEKNTICFQNGQNKDIIRLAVTKRSHTAANSRGALLQCERAPLTLQKESFQTVKGHLSQRARQHTIKRQLFFTVKESAICFLILCQLGICFMPLRIGVS